MLDLAISSALPDNGIVLIIGRRGGGKSVIGNAILEYEHAVRNRNVLIYNFPKPELLPNYISITDDLEFKEGSVVLVDEGYMNFSARKGMNANNKFIDNLNGLARQKDLLIIYITQESARIDINIVRGTEVLIVKALSINQVRFERKEYRIFLSSIKDAIDALQTKERIQSAAYITSDLIGSKFEGLVENACSPPWYWNEDLSKAWSNIDLSSKERKKKEE